MSRTPAEYVLIDVALPSERRAALELALGSRRAPPPTAVIDRALAETQTGDEEWRGLLVARIAPPGGGLLAGVGGVGSSRLVGAIWVRSLAGRISTATVPQTTADAPDQTGAILLRRAIEVAERRESVLVQALAEADDAQAAADFATAGFRHTTDLLFLVADCQTHDDENPIADVEWVQYNDEHYRRLAALVERTYIDSRDCPELDGVRAIDDVLAGYRATGEFAAERWLIGMQGGRDVGCLLLADHPADDQWELVYLGVAPEFRGRGLGLAITREALRRSRRADRARLVLAVDAENAPAIAIYRRAGFETWERRAIFLRRFDKPREM